MSNNQGMISQLVWWLAVIILILILGYGAIPATPEDIQDVVHKANNNPAAMEIVKSSLKSTPEPTNWDLSELRQEVDAQLRVSIAKEVTGDTSLKMDVEKKNNEHMKVNKEIGSPVVQYAILGMLALIFLALIVAAVRGMIGFLH